ncbi:hypothetical protein WA026_008238 [Henosepilachna vigintioctopunctata]|uniref:Uncharacterized protein n=1 Tax=Henosepilachna vigintioctopunctata TaxID=420089 RepID=A0AAW1TRI2_9CUCU
MLNPYTQNSYQVHKELSYSKIPEITSTPYGISPCKYRKLSTLFTPRRIMGSRCSFESLSNVTPSSIKRNNDAPEPMLTSTRFNVIVRNYIRSKSRGYTGTLVQYNGESSRVQQLTHQEKYGSPDIFPRIHLFQKDIPIIEPKQTTLRIETSDIKAQYSQDHNTLIPESIVRTNSVIKKNSHSGNELSPKTLGVRTEPDVSKALSRKRSHATEDYERDGSNKKLRENCMVNGDCDGDSSYETREVDSTKSDACTTKWPSQQ